MCVIPCAVLQPLLSAWICVARRHLASSKNLAAREEHQFATPLQIRELLLISELGS